MEKRQGGLTCISVFCHVGEERVREIAKPLANPNTQHSQRRRQQHPLLNAIQARWLVAAVCQRLPDASESFFQLSQFIICFA